MTRRKKWIFVCGMLLLLLLLSYFWLWQTNYNHYERYAEGFKKPPASAIIGKIRHLKNGGCDYSVKFPPIPSMIGNLFISNAQQNASLIIWPKSVFAEDVKFGLIIELSKNEAVSMDVNKKMQLINESKFDDLALAAAHEHSAEIAELKNNAMKQWGEELFK